MKINRFIALLSGITFGLSLFAQSESRDHRYDSFKGTPTEPGQIVFAGNSITHMHSWFEAFGSAQEVIGRGNWGGYAFEMLDHLESYIDGKPAKFFVMIGTNDIGHGYSYELTARRIETIVKRVRIESPETDVYVQSILPRSNSAKPDYEQCNAIVKAWVEEQNDEKIHFINLSEVCAGLNGNAMWSYDGLHPRPIGYAAWTHHIENEVGHKSVYPETITTQNGGSLSGASAARAEQFPYYQLKEGDVLFFGDEQVHGGEWHELLRSDKIKDRGMQWSWGGISLPNAKNVVQLSIEKQEHKPAKVFLFYGIGGQNETNYRLLVDEAKKQVPNGKVYLVSLSPSTNAETDKTRVSFNAFMQSVATEKDVTYVDVYTPLKQDIEKNIMGTNYISGRGYVVMANALAEYLEEEKVNPVSLEEYDAVYARRTARKIIGDALTSAYMLNYGDELGQIAESARNDVESFIPDLITVLNDPDLTTQKANAAVSAINAAIKTAQTQLNMPQASTDEEEYWYTLTSVRGTTSTLTATNGKLVGANAPDKETDGSNVWKFVAKADGTYDIVNPKGEYVSPTAAHNSQLSVTVSTPSTGWKISYSEASPGAYVIYTSNCQLNQTGLTGFPVYNWYGSAPTPNRADEGCAYNLSLYGVETKDPDDGKGEEVGIVGITSTAPTTTFDLQGRRVSAPSRGIYVVNGTKTLLK